MQLFLIRHGESYNNALEDITQRVADPPLTELGEAQARRVGAYVAAGGHLDESERARAGAGFDHLYCSPMLRALQTAQPIAEGLGQAPEVWIDTHEVGGIWLTENDDLQGMPRERMQATFPGYRLPQQVGAGGWWPGGQETAHAGRGRALGVAMELKTRARRQADAGRPREWVAIVTHGDFMSALVKALLDHLPSWGVYYTHKNTAITRFQLDPEGCVVHYLNRSEHLTDAGRAAP